MRMAEERRSRLKRVPGIRSWRGVSTSAATPFAIFISSCDHSYRCFHFDVDRLLARSSLTVKVMALSGSTWIDFQGFGWEREGAPLPSPTANERWDAMFDLTQVLERDRQLLENIRSGAVPFDNQR